jgi:hypothetical protein
MRPAPNVPYDGDDDDDEGEGEDEDEDEDEVEGEDEDEDDGSIVVARAFPVQNERTNSETCMYIFLRAYEHCPQST